jgi:hypothetical protein
MFCYNFSKKRNFNLKICTDSNLEKLFKLDIFKSKQPEDLFNYFSEEFSYDIIKTQELDQSNLEESLKILNNPLLEFPNNICFSGWFYNTPLYSKSFFDEIKIKKHITDYIETEFNRIFTDDSITLHYRGTDFNGHLGYDLRLPFEYYKNCILHMKKNYKHIKNIYIFSDDKTECLNIISAIKNIDDSFNIEFIQNEFYIDWTCLHLSKNIISSNSSFCSTACIYNKEICYQPDKYQLRNTSIKGVYPNKPFFKNSYIL